MLSALSIKNVVLIDQLDLELDAGLTALTGETGAGKSILLDALTLALGGRGDQSLVRRGCESGQVTAELVLQRDHPARKILRENDIADEDVLMLRRVQFADGRTRAFVNDQSVSAALLKQLGALLIEIHGQHDSRALVDAVTHRALLDSFGGLEGGVEAVAQAHKLFVEADEAVAAQRARNAQAAAEEEFAQFVVEELTSLAAEKGEEEALAERRQRLMALEKSADEVRDADEILNGSGAPGPALSTMLRRLARKGDDSLFAGLIEALDAGLVALDRVNDALETIKRDMAFDPAELEQSEERLFALRAAARKHQVSCDDLPDILARYAKDLKELRQGEESLTALEQAASAAKASYVASAEKLSAARAKSAEQLEGLVAQELPDLKLGAAKFIVDRQVDETRVSAVGFDQISFHVQTNPGTAAGPMMKVASGGELSRFLLALKVVLADRGSAPVLIFDEIDTGVGGAVADAIGRRLARLADKVQVLSVTHAPQVAARANAHLLIEKQAMEEGAFVRTQVGALMGDTRNEEVARMLAGASITDEARAAASKLLSEVQ